MKPLKVAIIGSAKGWEDAPWDDPSYEIWSLNDQYLMLSPEQLKRVTRWWELHGDTPITRSRRPSDHWARVDALNIPTYTLHSVPVRNARRLDVAALEKVANRRYFSCTMTYQVALAMSEGATHIELYGVVMSSGREALVERPCLEWWIGFAEGHGIAVKVGNPYEHGFGKHPYRYALDDQDERFYSYTAVEHYMSVSLPWLLAETKRLNLQPEPFLIEQEIDA